MRLRLWRIAGGSAAASLMLAAVTGCGGSSGPGAGVGGSEPEPGLPSAGTMADIESFVAGRTTCTGMHLEAEDPESESVGSEWGVKERGVCYDADGMGIRLLVVKDMKAFQARAKERGGGYFVGKDFAVYSADQATTVAALKESGLLYLFCEDPAGIPSGFKKDPALVDGCVLTNHTG